MKIEEKIRRRDEQSGIALLLAIFVLLLVCVVGIAMLAASGTETSLTGNYRSSTAVYYAAFSGLEEGRGRLLPQSLNSLSPSYIPPYGSTMPIGQAVYIINPLSGETVDPTALGNPDEYPDTEWVKEFPSHNPPSPYQTVPSVTNLSGSPNPLYKWIRINALTEQALQIDVNNSGGSFNSSQIIYFDGKNLTRTVQPYQSLGVTALAGLPDGSRKLLQYVVGPVTLGLQFNAAITMASPGISPSLPSFNPPAPGPPYTFFVNGGDQSGSPGLGCPVQPPVAAFGVFNSPDVTNVVAGTSSNSPGNYSGTAPSNNVVQVSSTSAPAAPGVPTNWEDPVQLNNLVQTIQNSADSVITGPATASDMPGAMTAVNPMTIVVNGDLTLSGFSGYGLLVVTGNFTYYGDSGWKGIVLVIGKGTVVETGSVGGGEFDGAVFLANTTGGVLGATSWTVANPGGKGVYYNTCWIAASQKPITYKVLSFREIPYP
jgi:hypothetical protein